MIEADCCERNPVVRQSFPPTTAVFPVKDIKQMTQNTPPKPISSKEKDAPLEDVVDYCIANGLISFPEGKRREFSAEELLKLKLARVFVENMKLLEHLSIAYIRLKGDQSSGIISESRTAANKRHTLELVDSLLKGLLERASTKN